MPQRKNWRNNTLGTHPMRDIAWSMFGRIKWLFPSLVNDHSVEYKEYYHPGSTYARRGYHHHCLICFQRELFARTRLVWGYILGFVALIALWTWAAMNFATIGHITTIFFTIFGIGLMVLAIFAVITVIIVAVVIEIVTAL